jgi:hypothetical protein
LRADEKFRHSMRPIEHQQLSEYSLQVVFHRACADIKNAGDFLVALADLQPVHDLDLAFAQVVLWLAGRLVLTALPGCN